MEKYEKKFKRDKTARILGIYTKLMNGYEINKDEEAKFYGVDNRSIQRDIADIRHHIANETANTGFINSLEYDCVKKVYRLEQSKGAMLSNSEALAVCKILLDSRAFTKKEMGGILDKLIRNCLPKSAQKQVTNLIINEKYHYVELQHNAKRSKDLMKKGKYLFIDNIWEIGQAILNQQYINIKYMRTKDKKEVGRTLQPLAIMFSEYYFYLAAFIDDEQVREDFTVKDDKFPTIYRIDRITDLKVLDKKFNIVYENRFQEGEFRKRIQFMYGGKLRRIKFLYKGASPEPILDRLPTAKVIGETDEGYVISAEVFGDGVDMWLRSQGDNIKMIRSE